MCKRFIFCLIALPVLLFGSEYDIPMGSSGNKIILNVHNAGFTTLKDAKVIVTDLPSWISVQESAVSLPVIDPFATEDAVIYFETSDSESGLTGQIVLQVQDKNGILLTEKEYTISSSAGENSESMLSVYPNPANPTTTIPFVLKEESHVRIDIFNMLGQRVRTLLDENKVSGKWEVNWDGRNAHGIQVASGAYVIRMQANANGGLKQSTTKIMLQK